MARLWQTVRVFISSTFRDMHSERDWLVKRVFPALRERLEKYRVHLIDIDLRWGVTEQQAESGGALDVCLDQIDDCRPFFLGILGERYGFVSNELLERIRRNSKYASLKHASGKSITELEILYGVLNDPKMFDHSLFCFRNPGFIDKVPVEKQSDMRSETEPPDSAAKLQTLKTAILNTPLTTPPYNYDCEYAGLRVNWPLLKTELAGNPQTLQVLRDVARDGLVDPDEYKRLTDDQQNIVHRYGTVQLIGLEEFGEQVKEWLWKAIRQKLNLPDQPPTMSLDERDTEADKLEREQNFHELFMESRLRVHVGRKGIRNQLAEYADSDRTRVCLISGSSGSGKTTALARFLRVYQRAHRQTTVVPHFIGASPDSTSLRLMLRRLCTTLKQVFGFAEEVEEDPQRLIGQFKEFLFRVPTERRVLIVLDALNQLDDTDRAHQLHWLPWELPGQVKVIVSCIDDAGRDEPVLKELRKRQHEELRIEALTYEERRQIIGDVPSLSAKTLDDGQVSLLLENEATRNPLFLLVALEELRGFGSFEQLNARIRAFPKNGDTVTAVFVQVIKRLETEFGADLTRDILTLLASARRGLSQRELQDLTKSHNNPDELFAILRQLRPYLQPRGELLDFYHRNLFKAVRETYLDNADAEIAVHTRLGDYFAAQEYFLESLEQQRERAQCLPYSARPVNIRKIDELLWQRLRAGEATACETLLTDLDYLEARNEAGQVFDLANDFAHAIDMMSEDRPMRRILRLLDEALRRDIHFIARHSDDYPQGLFQCLWNNGWWYDCPDAETHYAIPEGGWREQPPWVRDGRRMHSLLESWHRNREGCAGGYFWLRSLRPPSVHLGTALRAVLRGHQDTVASVAYSSDGGRIVSGAWDKTVRVWDVTSGTVLAVLRGHLGLVKAATFSPDATRIVSGDGEGIIRVWDAISGAEHMILRGHTWSVSSVSYSPDGSRIISGSGDKTVRVWDAASGAELSVFRGHKDSVNCISYSTDGTRIASGSDDKSVRVWDIASGAELAMLCGHKGAVISVSFSIDGTRIVSGGDFPDGTIRVWNADSGAEFAVFEHSGNPIVSFSPDGTRIVVGGSYDNTVRVRNVATRSESQVLCGHEGSVTSVSYSPDGSRIVSGSRDKTVRVWDAASGMELAALRGHQKSVNATGYTPDGTRLVSGSSDESLRIWDAASGAELAVLRRHDSWVMAASYSPDGAWIASGCHDGTVHIWDAVSGSKLTVLRGHEYRVNSVSYSLDGTRIVSGSDDKTVRMWDVATGSELAVLRGHGGWVTSVSFSADGTRIVTGSGILGSSGDRTLRIWDAMNGAMLAVFYGHDDNVSGVSFSPDGTRVVSSSTGRKLRVWDAANGECIKVFQGRGDVVAVATGAHQFPWWALEIHGELDTVIEEAATGRPVAWFSEQLSHFTTHPGGRAWAGGVGSHLCLIQLEGPALPRK